MTHVAGLDQKLREDGYELRRTGPLRWGYFDLHDESGDDVLVAEGESPAAAGSLVLKKRYN